MITFKSEKRTHTGHCYRWQQRMLIGHRMVSSPMICLVQRLRILLMQSTFQENLYERKKINRKNNNVLVFSFLINFISFHFILINWFYNANNLMENTNHYSKLNVWIEFVHFTIDFLSIWTLLDSTCFDRIFFFTSRCVPVAQHKRD